VASAIPRTGGCAIGARIACSHAIRSHHLNCISFCPLGGRLMDGRSGAILQRGQLCCHCILLETEQGLVLIDTGFGVEDVRAPRRRLSGFFLALLSPDFRQDMTAVAQVRQLGFRAEDVRHIVLTHLDFDHAGGLDDFPNARVHLLRVEQDRASARSGWLDRQRYRPQQWSSRPRGQAYDGAGGEPWFGFEAVRALQGLPPEILLVPLPGHTVGHAAVAFEAAGRWHLQAGDAYFWHAEMDFMQPRCTPGLRLYQWLMEQDRERRLLNQERLRTLRKAHGDQVRVMCSRDPLDFEALTGRSSVAPVGVRLSPGL
jgi:glyoxylase-like metal-dependent hydrolase (beta-lactamase superfamily II)